MTKNKNKKTTTDDAVVKDKDGFLKPSSNKRPSYPAKDLKPKKTKGDINLENRFESLSDLSDIDDDMSLSSAKSQSQPEFINPSNPDIGNIPLKEKISISQKPKPIVVETNDIVLVQNIIKFLENLQLKNNYSLKKSGNNRLLINTFNKEDKEKIILEMKNNNTHPNKHPFNFHTYTEPNEKNLVFVLKGHYFISTEELLGVLKSLNIDACKVSFLNKFQENPSYLVQFRKDSINIQTLIYQHSIIHNLVVKWEKFRKTKKNYTQCYNCQLYGHSSKNCGRQYRCVKCMDHHAPGKCPRTTKEGTAHCVNCKGDHSANHKACKYFLNYKKSIVNSSQKKTEVRYFKSTPAPWSNLAPNIPANFICNQNDFPDLNKPHHRADAVKSKNTNINDDYNLKFFNLQEEFQSIANIAETMKLFKELILKLKSSNNHNARLSILMQYCTPQNE